MTPRIQPIRWTNPARGSSRKGRTVVVLYLKQEIVDEIRAEAMRKGVSLSEQLRQVIDWGLASMEEVKK